MMLSMEHFKGRKFDPNWSYRRILTEVCFVAKKEMSRPKPSFDDLKGKPQLKIPLVAEQSLTWQDDTTAETETKKGGELEKPNLPKAKRDGEDIINSSKLPESKRPRIRIICTPMPDLPEEYKNRIEKMNGRGVKFVIQKRLTATDVNPLECRLSIPAKQVLSHDFVTEKEKEKMKECIDKKRSSIKARLIGPFQQEGIDEQGSKIQLRRWNYGNGSCGASYVLAKHWNKFRYAHQLNKDDLIQLYSFRLNDGKLRFALVLVEKGKDNEEG